VLSAVCKVVLFALSVQAVTSDVALSFLADVLCAPVLCLSVLLLLGSFLQPAVPFAGLFRLIDVPVSNCIHSGISNIYVLTQYNATSLNRHLSRAYQFLNGITFQGGQVLLRGVCWCVFWKGGVILFVV
jgi:hypothetical protein